MKLLMLAMALVVIYGLVRVWIAVRSRARSNEMIVEWKAGWDSED